MGFLAEPVLFVMQSWHTYNEAVLFALAEAENSSALLDIAVFRRFISEHHESFGSKSGSESFPGLPLMQQQQ